MTYSSLWYLLIGFLLGNGMPHFLFGSSGAVFRTPFGRESSPQLNVGWGLFNFLLASLLSWWRISVSPLAGPDLLLLLTGFWLAVLMFGVFLRRFMSSAPQGAAMESTAAPNTYIPGMCNIGPAEIRKRKQAGWTGLIATTALWALFLWFDVPALWRLALFVPAAMSATGFLQAYLHFCAYFGFASLFNFGNVGTTDTVSQAEFRAKDRRKAWQIVLYASLIGAVVALAGYFL